MTATPRAMARGRLIAVMLGALAIAMLIVFGAILPAEFNKDPLGLGRLTGIARLWAAPETTIDAGKGGAALAREFDRPYRTDVVEIPLGGFLTGSENSELEYKVRMRKGEALVYSWTVEGAELAEEFHFDQHGHTTPAPGQEMTVATYKQAWGLKQNGTLTAPFDGIQGWQFSNSAEKPVVVRLKLAGFYDLVPAGQPGNEASVVANVPAAQARPGAPLAMKVAP
jgi:hypothetical protein